METREKGHTMPRLRVAAFRTSVQASSSERDDIASLVHRDAHVAVDVEDLELGHLIDEGRASELFTQIFLLSFSPSLSGFLLLIFYSLRSLLTSRAADEQLELLQQVLLLRLHLLGSHRGWRGLERSSPSSS